MFSGWQMPSWKWGVDITGNLQEGENILQENNLGGVEEVHVSKPPPPKPGPIEIPLVRRSGAIPDAQNGTIHVFGQNVFGAGWEDVFSFSFYFLPTSSNPNEIYETIYYKGLIAYAKMVISKELKETMGMIVYTNEFTFPYLMEAFNLNKHSNILLAIPSWPAFTVPGGPKDPAAGLEHTVLRTLRYHAVELFPNANVHMRDADTLFVPMMKYNDFYDIVLNWEMAYLRFTIPKITKEGKQIILGTFDLYKQKTYHLNLPYPVEFSVPPRIPPYSNEVEQYAAPKPNPYRFLYVRENKGKVIPFFSYLKKKYMFDPEQGLYAGFVSVLKDRRGIEDFWERCVRYMVERYRMVTNPEDGKRILSNDLIRSYKQLPTGTLSWRTRTHYAIGKDERMLLYAIIPEFLKATFFFYIPYSSDARNMNMNFYRQTFLLKRNTSNAEARYFRIFSAHSQAYQEWLADFFAKYPTEKAFLDALDANIGARVVPMEELAAMGAVKPENRVMKYTNFNPNSPSLPYRLFNKAGRRITLRRGGGQRRKTRRHRI